MTLTESAILEAKQRLRSYRLYDGDGLYLEVSTAGARRWYCHRTVGGKNRRHRLGQYPAVGLEEARARRDELFLE